jgi:MscS family membrane protein
MFGSKGLLGIGVTEIIISALIFIGGAIIRAFFVGRVMAQLEKLTSDTESEIDDVLLESLKKPLGYIPLTVAIYCIAVYLPLSWNCRTFCNKLDKSNDCFHYFYCSC